MAAAFPWIAVALFAVGHAVRPGDAVLFSSAAVSICLFVFMAHEWLSPGTGLAWSLAAAGILSLLPLALSRQVGPAGLAIAYACLASAAAVLLQASRVFAGIEERIRSCRRRIGEPEGQAAAKIRGNLYYSARRETLKSQIGYRRALSSYAREVGTLYDPNAIRDVLTAKIQSLFPRERVVLKTAAREGDPVDAWINDRKTSLLVRDLPADRRLTPAAPARSGPQVLSAIAMPLHIGRSRIGLLRIDSASANRFSESDLQEVEVYVHLAGLALENSQLFAKVNAMATQDGLTGLATHRIFQEKLSEEILRAVRYRQRLSLMMVDIDHFKSVNDVHGHLAGDEVLRSVASVLREHSGSVDFPARYGGEEFCVILPQSDSVQTAERAENLRKAVESRSVAVSGADISVTVSIGCATVPEDAQISSQLIGRADERLYRAKAAGRNRVVGA